MNEVNKVFDGMFTGAKDSNGVPIRCGDILEFWQRHEAYTETESMDGWGRTIPLCRHDQREVPAKEKTTMGIVVYDPNFTGFVVQFDDYLLGTYRKEERLYMVCFENIGEESPQRVTVLEARD